MNSKSQAISKMSQCNLCNNLKKKSEDDVRLAFDFVPSELDRSAEAKCPACDVILAGILHSEDGWTLAEDVTHIYVFGLAKEEDSLSLELYFRDDRPKVVLEFYRRERNGLLSSGEVNWEVIKPKSPLSGHPMSPTGMKWLNTRLDVCKNKHFSCQYRANTNLPKRTLSFRVSRNGKAGVRLVENGSQLGRYIALSHCWGSSQLCVLDGKTISQFKKSIPWSRLPKTFQDAILFSAKLGVNHIWIDALCIVQDDPDDWERESARMADIYQNSFLTLAATASSNGMGGCFSDAKTVALSEHELTGSQSLVGLDPIVVRTKLQHWAWPPSKASMKLHPLLSRGWAFQERILSPRVLHFCKDELLWECREESICECGSLPALPETKKQSYVPRNETAPRWTFGRKTWRRAFGKIKITMFRRKKTSPKRQRLSRIAALLPRKHSFPGPMIYQEEASNVTNPEKLDAAENWHRVIEQYSSLSLTKQTDRLPALSGLSIRSSPVLGEYLAGLWKHSLVSDLLWRINELEHDIVRPTEYIAPSWSWASVTGPASFWPEPDTRLIRGTSAESLWYRARSELIKRANNSRFTATVEASRLNPYGKVSSGILFVHGYIQPARLQYVSTRVGGAWGYTTSLIEPVPLKYKLEIIFSDETHGRIPSIELPFFADYVLQAEGPLRIPDNDQLHLLLIHPYMCLVLKSLDEKLKTFRRIGIIRQPVALVSEYGFDWMVSSVENDIQIL
ncbi:heterokaryon incompatibility protein-domain-containing protein [Hyaloscypha finlandica]|nr:heterokaryon incompatibility protein-domain-containing protein [Hyaloscypha finlandica]